MLRESERHTIQDEWLSILAGNEWSASLDEEDIFPLLTEEEQAVILDEDLGKDITTGEIERFAPGYRQRILSGLFQKIEVFDTMSLAQRVP